MSKYLLVLFVLFSINTTLAQQVNKTKISNNQLGYETIFFTLNDANGKAIFSTTDGGADIRNILTFLDKNGQQLFLMTTKKLKDGPLEIKIYVKVDGKWIGENDNIELRARGFYAFINGIGGSDVFLNIYKKILETLFEREKKELEIKLGIK